jgi:hypothetical protein
MVNRQLPLFALACVVVLGSTLTARAGERELWRHSKGVFVNTGGGDWVEKAPDGGTYYFHEKFRASDYVLLYDDSRECYVRLYRDVCLVKFGKGSYEEYYRGHWK